MTQSHGSEPFQREDSRVTEELAESGARGHLLMPRYETSISAVEMGVFCLWAILELVFQATMYLEINNQHMQRGGNTK